MSDAVPAARPLARISPLPATGPYKSPATTPNEASIRLVRNPRFHVWSAAAQPAGFPDQIVERFGYTPVAPCGQSSEGTADITAEQYQQTWPPGVRILAQQAVLEPHPQRPTLMLDGILVEHEAAALRQCPRPAGAQLRGRPQPPGRVRRRPSTVSQVDLPVLAPNMTATGATAPTRANPDAAGTYNGPDLAKARRLVEASGTKGQSVTVWFPDKPIGRLNGAYLALVLATSRLQGPVQSLRSAKSPNWKPDRQVGVSGWAADYPSTNNFFEPVFTCRSYTPNPSTNNNIAAFCNHRPRRRDRPRARPPDH